ncbi:MAG: phthalyl amidase, partial [Acidimicrobiales bacterium]
AGAAAVLTATGGLALGVGAAPAGASPTTTATAAATFSAPAAKPAPPTSVGARSGYTIADPRFDYNDANGTYGAPFVALTGPSGPISTVNTGVYKEAAYRVEVPQKWNGDLVLFAHGYRGTGNVVFVDSPALRKYFVAHGFAWAASSYADNGYDVAQGVIDTHNLFTVFGNVTGRTPKATYMTGDSMGGHITAVEIEHYKGSFVGAMPYCGVLGGNTLFNYFLDANVTAAALTGTKITYPLTPPPASFAAQYAAKVTTSILPKLGTGFNTASGPTLSPLGQEWETSVEYSTGGLRPGFASAFSYWNSFGFAPLTKIPFLFGLYPGLQGGTVGVAPGNVASNTGAVYRVDANQHLSPADQALN